MRLNIIFGSTSDEEKVLPGIERAVKEIPDLEVAVHYASADNTPEKVKRIMEELSKKGEKVYLSGAGMANVLTGVVKTYAGVDELVIGIPILDSTTNGLSAILSTAEKPSLNPVLTVSLDNSYAAVNIAMRFRNGTGDLVVYAHPDNIQENDQMRKAFESLGLPYKRVESAGAINPDSVVVTLFTTQGILYPVDTKLSEGKGIQVAVISKSCFPEKEEDYAMMCQGTQTTGFVTAGNYANAAQIAAVLTRDESALDIIDLKKEQKFRDLNSHPGLLVTREGIQKLGGGE